MAGAGGAGGADIATSQLTMRCGSNIFASRPPPPMLAGAGSLAGPSSACASPGARARAVAGRNRRRPSPWRPSRRRLRHCCCWAGPAPTRPHSGSRFLPNPSRCGARALRCHQAQHGAFLWDSSAIRAMVDGKTCSPMGVCAGPAPDVEGTHTWPVSQFVNMPPIGTIGHLCRLM